MGWADTRRAVEAITHGTFNEPATFAPLVGASFAVAGVFTEQTEAQTVTDETGYEATKVSYEIRKAADEGPWSLDDFPIQGQLTLATGAAYVVVTHEQTDTLILLGLAAVEE